MVRSVFSLPTLAFHDPGPWAIVWSFQDPGTIVWSFQGPGPGNDCVVFPGCWTWNDCVVFSRVLDMERLCGLSRVLERLCGLSRVLERLCGVWGVSMFGDLERWRGVSLVCSWPITWWLELGAELDLDFFGGGGREGPIWSQTVRQY